MSASPLAAARSAFPLVARRYVPLYAGAGTALACCWVVPVAAWIQGYRDEIQRRVFFSPVRSE